jgi:DNA-binding beta-propeller fold protein YncE
MRSLRAAMALLALFQPADRAPASEAPYRSPFDVALSSDGRRAYASDFTAAKLVALDLDGGAPPRELVLQGQPAGLALSADGSRLYVAEHGAGAVAEVDAASMALRRRLAAGRRPMGVALAESAGLLVVANTVEDDLSIVDLESGRERARVRVPREPHFVAVCPDGRLALAGNLLPAGSPAEADHAACVSWVELPAAPGAAARLLASVKLPPGSTSVRELAISSDGRRAYAVHTLGRYQVPATQVERGWINTNALSVLDVPGRRLLGTVLLDRFEAGAADPWGAALSPAGDRLWISLRGVHEVAAVDVDKLHRLIESASAAPAFAAASALGLQSDLEALDRAGAIARFALPGRGPRGIAASADGKHITLAAYFSGDVLVLDAATGALRRRLPLGPQPEADAARRGEELFHDATLSLQGWLSCSSCHPNRGRKDALRWDLPNDGLGTPQMTRSLFYSFRVAPTTARGVRPSFEASAIAGFRFLHAEPEPDKVADVMAFLSALRPEPSPHLAADGALSPTQERGRALFEGKGRCATCHLGELRTDLKPHDVGSAGAGETGGASFYTPKLLELYRGAPFLHDGRAADLLEVFTRHNSGGRHGGVESFSPPELEDLIAYLLTF